MNDKLCKYLRGQAKDVATKQKWPEYQLVTPQITRPNQPHKGVIFNNPESQRGVYRQLKKYVRKHLNGNAGRVKQAAGS